MAKDPAFLFYPGDWQGGTMIFTRFLKGCYIDILIAQFNSGHLSLEEIKTVLGSDFGQAWPTLQKKFKKDDDGLFFNEKLETEMIKRKEYSKSRADNRKKKDMKQICKTHEPTYVLHMENENEIINDIKDSIKKESSKNVPREFTDESLQDVEFWTSQVLDGNDALFLNMVRNNGLILNGQLEPLARDHLGKCARYNWHERITTQQAFRHSLLNYITENLKKPHSDKNGKAKVSLTELNQFRKGNV